MGWLSSNKKVFSANPNDYKLLEEIGYGATATVYRAIYLPRNEVVAVKSLDLDRCNSNLDDIRREAQTMSLIDHPNVVKSYCSFAVDHNLWVVMPYMAQGSCLHLMKTAYQDGFEEPAIAYILKETLKALEYLHRQGHIHRDVKAGNILLDTNGEVKLADFGVSACMFDTADRQRSRNTFVGTPCWMAPEVLQPGNGYNFKADIWSFGITALELAHGHAPFSKYPPMKVLLMTIQNAPPGLDYDRDKKFSKAFKELVAMCLVKDQTKRPTAEKLLKHSFFKHMKPSELSVKKLFADLPPLWDRVRGLQLKDAAQLALKKMPSSEQEALSQSEYQRGVSAWNFDIQDLKAQASLVQDDDDILETGEKHEFVKNFISSKNSGYCGSNLGRSNSTQGLASTDGAQQSDFFNKKGKIVDDDLCHPDHQERKSGRITGSFREVTTLVAEKDMGLPKNKTLAIKVHQSQSGPLLPGNVLGRSSSERGRFFDRSDSEHQTSEKASQGRRSPSFSGPLMLPTRASANSLSAPMKSSGGLRDSLDDKSKANLVQIKGRFSVTSENLDIAKDIPLSTVSRQASMVSPLKKSASVGDWRLESKPLPSSSQPAMDLSASYMPTSILLLHLQNLFQQTSIQQDLIMNLLSSLQLADPVEATHNGKLPPLPPSSENNGSVDITSSERERLLIVKISELQARMISLTDELTTEKLKHTQLQQKLNFMSSKQENGRWNA